MTLSENSGSSHRGDMRWESERGRERENERTLWRHQAKQNRPGRGQGCKILCWIPTMHLQSSWTQKLNHGNHVNHERPEAQRSPVFSCSINTKSYPLSPVLTSHAKWVSIHYKGPRNGYKPDDLVFCTTDYLLDVKPCHHGQIHVFRL